MYHTINCQNIWLLLTHSSLGNFTEDDGNTTTTVVVASRCELESVYMFDLVLSFLTCLAISCPDVVTIYCSDCCFTFSSQCGSSACIVVSESGTTIQCSSGGDEKLRLLLKSVLLSQLPEL